MKKASPIILRVGMAAIILWFGFSQLSDATSWLGFLPAWTTPLPVSQIGLILVNGWFEVVFGFMLLFGFWTRFTAAFLFLHLLDITYTVGYGGIGVRDFGLTIAMIAIFFEGSSAFSFDYLLANDDHPLRQPMR